MGLPILGRPAKAGPRRSANGPSGRAREPCFGTGHRDPPCNIGNQGLSETTRISGQGMICSLLRPGISQTTGKAAFDIRSSTVIAPGEEFAVLTEDLGMRRAEERQYVGVGARSASNQGGLDCDHPVARYRGIVARPSL